MAYTKNPQGEYLNRGVAMHKSSHQVPKKARKKLLKELKTTRRVPLKAAEDLPETQAKKRKLYKKLLEKAEHEVIVKKHKNYHTSKQSKRTTPGEVDEFDANPHSFHMEGRRWAKTVQKQQIDRGKKLRRHLLKKSRKK